MSIESRKFDPEWIGDPKYWKKETAEELKPDFELMVKEARRRALEDAREILDENDAQFCCDTAYHDVRDQLQALLDKKDEV